MIIKIDVKKCDRMEDREQRTEQLSLMLGYILLYSMPKYVCFPIVRILQIAYLCFSEQFEINI